MEELILNFLSEFAIFIQNHGFAISESSLAHLLRLVEATEMEITNEDEILPALSICLAKTGEQSAKRLILVEAGNIKLLWDFNHQTILSKEILMKSDLLCHEYLNYIADFGKQLPTNMI